MRSVFILAALVILVTGPAIAADVPEIKKDCDICHVSVEEGSAPLKEPLSALCIRCHPDRVKADHPVDVKPSMPVEGLPLDEEGRMTCSTCHNPHGSTDFDGMLRAAPRSLCGQCHIK